MKTLKLFGLIFLCNGLINITANANCVNSSGAPLAYSDGTYTFIDSLITQFDFMPGSLYAGTVQSTGIRVNFTGQLGGVTYTCTAMDITYYFYISSISPPSASDLASYHSVTSLIHKTLLTAYTLQKRVNIPVNQTNGVQSFRFGNYISLK